MIAEPIITERSVSEAKLGKYTFKLPEMMRKPEISATIAATYGVTVTSIRTAIFPGKSYRTGKKWKYAYKPNWKKAIVTLKEGQVIDLFVK